MYYYSLFNLTIESPYQTGLLTEIHFVDNVDVKIKEVGAEYFVNGPIAEPEIENGVVVTIYPNTPKAQYKTRHYTYEVLNGSTISFFPRNSDIDWLWLGIIGGCLPTILRQRDVLVLHSNTIVNDNNEAIMFCGESGAGKSTLAAAAISSGCRLLADDTSPINFDDDHRPFVMPSHSYIKLWGETLKHFPELQKCATEMSRKLGKYYVEVDLCSQNIPVSRIYVLHKGDEIKVEKITGNQEKFDALSPHIKYVDGIEKKSDPIGDMSRLVGLIKKAEVYNLYRPKDDVRCSETLKYVNNHSCADAAAETS